MSANVLTKRAATIFVLASLSLATSASAFADNTPTPTPRVRAALTPRTPDAQRLSNVQQRCTTAITNRLTTLQKDVSKINAAANLTVSDKSALLGIADSEPAVSQHWNTALQRTQLSCNW